MSKYTQEHFQFLKDNVKNSEKELLKMFNNKFKLNISQNAIRSLKARLKIKSGLSGGKRKFSEDQVQFIKDNIKNTEKDLTKMFNERFETNVNVASISNLKSRLHLKSGLVGGRFQKGRTSFNKGKKWNEFMSEQGQQNSKKTCFQKGHTPKNHRPVGSERVNVDGYIEVKIAEPNVWKLKHRVVFEAVHGAIPKDQNCVFLDGNRKNCTIENLVLIPKPVNAIMNKRGLFSAHKELTESGITFAKLLSKISEKEKHEK